jgi:hypothetical protein
MASSPNWSAFLVTTPAVESSNQLEAQIHQPKSASSFRLPSRLASSFPSSPTTSHPHPSSHSLQSTKPNSNTHTNSTGMSTTTGATGRPAAGEAASLATSTSDESLGWSDSIFANSGDLQFQVRNALEGVAVVDPLLERIEETSIGGSLDGGGWRGSLRLAMPVSGSGLLSRRC